MKVVFAGTPEFAATALSALHVAGCEIVLVLTQADRPAGRGMQLQASAVKQFALAHDLPVAQPLSLRRDGKHAAVASQAHALLQATPHDVMVVAAYGLILPSSVLAIPPLGCINIHASLLPRWRGAAPIHRAIEAGDTETGITIMQMDQGLDTGAVLSMQTVAITPDDTTASLHDRLASLGGAMIVETIRQLAAQPGVRLPAMPQPDAGVTYAAKIQKEEAALDFRASAETVARKIRAFNPFPGALAHAGDTVLKLWQAQAVTGNASVRDATLAAGMVMAANAERGILIACGTGPSASVLRVTQLQKPGGKRLSAGDFIKGFPMAGQHLR